MIYSFVKVVKLHTKRLTLSLGSTVWHRVPVTRQEYAAGGLPTHEKTHINFICYCIIHSTKVQHLQIMLLTIILHIAQVHLNTVAPFSPYQQVLGGLALS